MSAIRALAGLAAVWLAGCSHPVEIDNDIQASAPAQVRALGEKVGEGQGAKIALKLPANYKVSKDGINTTACLYPCDGQPAMSEALTVELQTKCGAIEYCVERQPLAAGSKLAMRGLLRGRKRAGFDSCSPEVYRLWIDNRGQKAFRLTVGEAVHEVEAGITEQFTVAAPPCAGMGVVGIDGQPIGELPLVADGLDWQHYSSSNLDFLVDPTGARCYLQTRYQYAPQGEGGASEPENEQLTPAKLHALSRRLDHFLAPAPEQVETPGGRDDRTQLMESNCAPPSPVP